MLGHSIFDSHSFSAGLTDSVEDKVSIEQYMFQRECDYIAGHLNFDQVVAFFAQHIFVFNQEKSKLCQKSSLSESEQTIPFYHLEKQQKKESETLIKQKTEQEKKQGREQEYEIIGSGTFGLVYLWKQFHQKNDNIFDKETVIKQRWNENEYHQIKQQLQNLNHSDFQQPTQDIVQYKQSIIKKISWKHLILNSIHLKVKEIENNVHKKNDLLFDINSKRDNLVNMEKDFKCFLQSICRELIISYKISNISEEYQGMRRKIFPFVVYRKIYSARNSYFALNNRYKNMVMDEKQMLQYLTHLQLHDQEFIASVPYYQSLVHLLLNKLKTHKDDHSGLPHPTNNVMHNEEVDFFIEMDYIPHNFRSIMYNKQLTTSKQYQYVVLCILSIYMMHTKLNMMHTDVHFRNILFRRLDKTYYKKTTITHSDSSVTSDICMIKKQNCLVYNLKKPLLGSPEDEISFSVDFERLDYFPVIIDYGHCHNMEQINNSMNTKIQYHLNNLQQHVHDSLKYSATIQAFKKFCFNETQLSDVHSFLQDLSQRETDKEYVPLAEIAQQLINELQQMIEHHFTRNNIQNCQDLNHLTCLFIHRITHDLVFVQTFLHGKDVELFIVQQTKRYTENSQYSRKISVSSKRRPLHIDTSKNAMCGESKNSFVEVKIKEKRRLFIENLN